jgi:hypothetical protein
VTVISDRAVSRYVCLAFIVPNVLFIPMHRTMHLGTEFCIEVCRSVVVSCDVVMRASNHAFMPLCMLATLGFHLPGVPIHTTLSGHQEQPSARAVQRKREELAGFLGYS